MKACCVKTRKETLERLLEVILDAAKLAPGRAGGYYRLARKLRKEEEELRRLQLEIDYPEEVKK
jgi:hypothetical protein